METVIINIPDKKSALVKQLLKELGVTIKEHSAKSIDSDTVPNKTTVKTIDNAGKGKGLSEPITDIRGFVNSL